MLRVDIAVGCSRGEASVFEGFAEAAAEAASELDKFRFSSARAAAMAGWKWLSSSVPDWMTVGRPEQGRDGEWSSSTWASSDGPVPKGALGPRVSFQVSRCDPDCSSCRHMLLGDGGEELCAADRSGLCAVPPNRYCRWWGSARR